MAQDVCFEALRRATRPPHHRPFHSPPWRDRHCSRALEARWIVDSQSDKIGTAGCVRFNLEDERASKALTDSQAQGEPNAKGGLGDRSGLVLKRSSGSIPSGVTQIGGSVEQLDTYRPSLFMLLSMIIRGGRCDLPRATKNSRRWIMFCSLIC